MPGTGDELSLLGYGGMRFPMSADGKIDREKSEPILIEAASLGINYFDTAYVYHDGESETFMGEVFERNGLRGSINLATKLPSWLVESPGDMDRLLDEQLAKLRTDRIDYYLLHALSCDHWPRLRDMGAMDFLARAKADGRVRHAGFSFHDSADLFPKILREGDWDFCQIQYNVIDTNFQAGLLGLQTAYRMGVGVVVMEPLHGGLLAKPFPEELAVEAKRAGALDSPAALALRWLWSQREVGTVLSGMTRMEDLIENAAVADSGFAETLDEAERSLVKKWAAWLEGRKGTPCTGCKYCLPCPGGVNIPQMLRLYNDAVLDDPAAARALMIRLTDAGEHAGNCTACGKCEPLCPQGIPVAERLKEAARVLGEYPA